MKTQPIPSRSILTASAAVLCAFTIPSAHADSFGTGLNTFTIDFVNIGNAGNADDRAFDATKNTPGDPNDDEYASPYGGVPYTYRMGTYEISQDAITKATNLGMTNVTAGAHTGNKPATLMSWYEAAAFVNWLNDQRTTGLKAYQLAAGVTSLTPWASVDAWQAGGENLYRHKDAYYFLPSEDEWYKAAFHNKNDEMDADYWDYATGSNSIPTPVASGTIAGTAVYNGATSSPADIMQAGGLSAYGTMGQNGNVREWVESALDGTNNLATEGRAIRGGNWFDSEFDLRSSYRDEITPGNSYLDVGFRVASVPEPTSAVLMISAGLLAIARRRRRAAL